MQDAVAAAARLALLGALSAAAPAAQAFEFGEAQLRSALGEPLDVRVPLQAAGDAAPAALCLSVGDAKMPGVPAVRGAVVTVEGPPSAAHARIRTRGAIGEPAVTLQLRSGCAGAGSAAARDYILLLEPRAAGAPAVPERPATASAPAPFRPGAGYLLKVSAGPIALRRSATPHAAAASPGAGPPVTLRPSPTIIAPAIQPAAVPATPAPARARPVHVEHQWNWALGALAILLAALLGLLAWRRREALAVDEADPAESAADDRPATDTLAPPIEIAADPRPAVASDASLATRLPENHAELRRRYIQERFPEIERGAIAFDQPATVVKGARLFYEDGAVSRAMELLHFAIEHDPSAVKPWLALFEILRLERRASDYAQLAGRFRERHGDTEHWPKVRHFGHEIDPGNALFSKGPVDTLKTIGPREAKRLAAGAADGFDPIAENWLDAPMDFENEVLANDLRKALMSAAGLSERDLEPDPMPALRKVEMFTVA